MSERKSFRFDGKEISFTTEGRKATVEAGDDTDASSSVSLRKKA